MRKLRQSPHFQSPLFDVDFRRPASPVRAEIRMPAVRRAALSSAIVADSLGEPEPLKMQHFRGVYEKFQD
jgi:hypothetical protein